MNRLIELETNDPALRRAQEIVRLVRPVPVSESGMRRVRAALDIAPRRGVWRGVPLLVAAALCLLAAAAVAAAGVHLFSARAAQHSTIASVPSAPALARPSSPRSELPSRAPAADAPSSLGRESPAEPLPPARRSSSKPRSHVREKDAPQLDEVARIHEAATALRRDGDAAGAARLLDSLPANPESPLAEEALALRIEAARAQHAANLVPLATSYLKRYPNGRYAAAARQALAAPSP